MGAGAKGRLGADAERDRAPAAAVIDNGRRSAGGKLGGESVSPLDEEGAVEAQVGG